MFVFTPALSKPEAPRLSGRRRPLTTNESHFLRWRSRTDVRGGRQPPRTFVKTFGSLRQVTAVPSPAAQIQKSPVVVNETQLIVRRARAQRRRREHHSAPCQRLLLTRGHAFATAYSPPLPSALPMATNSWVDPDVLDSMIGATRISEASASASAKNFVMGLSPFGGWLRPPWTRRFAVGDRPTGQQPSASGTSSSSYDPSLSESDSQGAVVVSGSQHLPAHAQPKAFPNRESLASARGGACLSAVP